MGKKEIHRSKKGMGLWREEPKYIVHMYEFVNEQHFLNKKKRPGKFGTHRKKSGLRKVSK